ncbi:MAG TPA: YoaK family protein [Verrucomicrobiae bacterium]
MISKLPRWVWAGAWVLAFDAGIVNVVGLLGFEHQAITHLTGSTSLLAIGLATLNTFSILHFAALLGSFVAGTVLSGFIIQDTALQLGRRYGVALVLESILLCAAVPLLQRHYLSGLYCAACACGLQNAMMTTYSGTVIRTTHLSGMFTDLGIFLGHALRGLPVDLKRMRLCLLIISGFLGGGVAGALAYHALNAAALFIPAGITAALSIAYGFYRRPKA